MGDTRTADRPRARPAPGIAASEQVVRHGARLELGPQIEYRCWGGMAVVFDRDDGGTRLVSALGAAVLELLADNGALERAALSARLQQWLAAPEASAAGLQPALEETLRDFHARRWVREAPPDP